MTLIDRHGVPVSSSVVQASSRWRVAWPRRPGTLPSVAARPSASLVVPSGMASSGYCRADAASDLGLWPHQIGL